MTIPNDSYVIATDIGTDEVGLLCNTERSGCCRTSDGALQGHWYLPNGTQVESFTHATIIDPTGNFFSRNRDMGIVRLNRNGNPPQRGRFRCEIPNAAGDLVNLYVHIGE